MTACESTCEFPAPAKVALDGAPKPAGCGVGAALQESPLLHGGGDTDAAAHGTLAEQTCAS